VRVTPVSLFGIPFITGYAVTCGLFKLHPAASVGIGQQSFESDSCRGPKAPVLRHCPGSRVLHVLWLAAADSIVCQGTVE
jgi:hypothetical protein